MTGDESFAAGVSVGAGKVAVGAGRAAGGGGVGMVRDALPGEQEASMPTISPSMIRVLV
jgi:hypothetical protein